jgi:hypothetical protein
MKNMAKLDLKVMRKMARPFLVLLLILFRLLNGKIFISLMTSHPKTTTKNNPTTRTKIIMRIITKILLPILIIKNQKRMIIYSNK